MDNFFIDITGEGQETLAKALEIAFEHNAPGDTATHYCVLRIDSETQYYTNKSTDKLPENVKGLEGQHVHHFTNYVKTEKGHLTLILLWTACHGATPLPYPMKVEDAVPFVKGWLANAGDPGKEPDIDGSLRPGWRVFTESWGHLAGCRYSIAGIQAVHAMYGK